MKCIPVNHDNFGIQVSGRSQLFQMLKNRSFGDNSYVVLDDPGLKISPAVLILRHGRVPMRFEERGSDRVWKFSVENSVQKLKARKVNDVSSAAQTRFPCTHWKTSREVSRRSHRVTNSAHLGAAGRFGAINSPWPRKDRSF